MHLALLLVAATVTPPLDPTPTHNAFTVLRDAIAQANDGQTITLSGNFDFDTCIDVPAGKAHVTLTGDATLSGTGECALRFLGANAGWTVSQLTFDGFETALSLHSVSIVLDGNRCNDVGVCVHTFTGADATIKNMHITGGRIGVLADASTLTVRDTQFWRQSEAGIRITGTTHMDASGGNAFQEMKALAIDNQVPAGLAFTQLAKNDLWDEPSKIEALVRHQVDDVMLGMVDFSSPGGPTLNAPDLVVSKRPSVQIPFPVDTNFEVINPPAYGTVDASGGYVRTHSMADSFTYRLFNATQLSMPGKVTLTNAAPAIQGAAPPTGTVGLAYGFTPIAQDENDDTLVFSVTGLSPWLKLNPQNGAISGVPPAPETTAPITISVTDGSLTTTLAPFVIVIGGAKGSAALDAATIGTRVRGSGWSCSSTSPELLWALLLVLWLRKMKR
jgi:hypothetical protein